MHQHAEDNEIIATVAADMVGDAIPTPTAAHATTDETGEASFPASDPPASWTWDVAGRPPGT